MGYQIKIDWAPAYELSVSLFAYFSKSIKTLELGPEWIRSVQQHNGEAFARLAELPHWQWLDFLIWHSPGQRDAVGFLGWLADCPVGHLYELLAPYALEDLLMLPPNLGMIRDRWVQTLTAWNDLYFRHLDPAILAGLAAEAAARREEAERLPAEEVVERATSGIQFIAPPGVEQVRLVPQYHYRPINIHGLYRGGKKFLYPADALPPAPGEPSPALLRLTRALDDKSRLRILRLLAVGEHSFTEIVQEMGLAKSTVHHHMVILRAAGLVRLQDEGTGVQNCTLRLSALNDLSSQLRTYLS